MNSNQKIELKINSKDIYKISPDLILNITLKNGYILIIDDSIPSQDVNNLIKNNKGNNIQHKNRNNNRTLNLNIKNSYSKDNINGNTFEINDSYLFNQNRYKREEISKSNNYTNNYFYPSYQNNPINNNQNEKENKESNIFNNDIKNNTNFKSQTQSISDIVTEKFHKKFHSNSKYNNNAKLITTINSEININIKGDETKKKNVNNLLKDFDELLLNFNDKKRGLINFNTCNNSKKKYKFYKKINTKKHDKLLLDDISGISTNTKAIKYIRRNEQKNSTIITENKNNFGLIDNNNSRISYLKEKSLKRNKSNNYYLIKNNKIINNIISPPNHLPYSKLLFIQNN